MSFTLISFYTKDWFYPEHALRLAEECDNLKIEHVIEELQSTGSYLKNTCLKPAFILEKLLELNSPVLWVDVDGSVLKFPTLMNQIQPRADFAAKRMAPERSRTWHVGTMWFNNTPATIEFLKKWIENVGNISDESALEKTWQDHGHLLRTYDLPSEYFHISRKTHTIPTGTVITHRISDGVSKRSELPSAIAKAKKGIY